jgi:hypothetical protein
MGRFALSWAATSDDRVECGAALGNAPSGPIPGNYLADVADCQVVANRARDTRGYWETYDWSDNEVDEFVYLDGEKTCHFSIRHVNTKSTNDVR